MAKCVSGHDVRPGLKFCPVCGEELLLRCPNGHEVSTEDKFCPECGVELSGPVRDDRKTSASKSQRRFLTVALALGFLLGAFFLGREAAPSGGTVKQEVQHACWGAIRTVVRENDLLRDFSDALNDYFLGTTQESLAAEEELDELYEQLERIDVTYFLNGCGLSEEDL